MLSALSVGEILLRIGSVPARITVGGSLYARQSRSVQATACRQQSAVAGGHAGTGRGAAARRNARRTLEQLARELVRQKKLTAFQAQQIYAGKGRSLVLGNYLILDKLGQGGMGMVLKAEHRRMDRLVALKVLSPTVTKTPALLARFQREVKAAARLIHQRTSSPPSTRTKRTGRTSW